MELPATWIHVLDLDTNMMRLHPWNGGLVEEYDIDTWWGNVQDIQRQPDEEYVFDVENLLSDFDIEVRELSFSFFK